MRQTAAVGFRVVLFAVGLCSVALGCASTSVPLDGVEARVVDNCGAAKKIRVKVCDRGVDCDHACAEDLVLALRSPFWGANRDRVKVRCDQSSGTCGNDSARVCWDFRLPWKATRAVLTPVPAKGSDSALYQPIEESFDATKRVQIVSSLPGARGETAEWGYSIELFYNEIRMACVDPRIVVEPP